MTKEIQVRTVWGSDERGQPMTTGDPISSRGWTVAALVAVLGLAALPTTAVLAGTVGQSLAAIEQELLRLIQFEPILVKASEALCRPAEVGPYDRADLDLQAWYFGSQGCELTYPVRPNALVSSLSLGASKRLFESPAALSRVNALLDQMQRLANSDLAPLSKLLLHSRAWEVAFGLQTVLDDHIEWQKAAGPTVERSLRLLDSTRFSERDLTRLPSTLADLPQQANAPQIAAAVAALLRHDPAYIEVIPTSDLHADVLLGRFTPRIFLTVTDVKEQARFQRFVQDPGTSYDDLRNLPQMFPGVVGILVLYFNVFKDDDTIEPTDVAAFWQSYTLTSESRLDLPFSESAKRISFFVIEGERSAEGLRFGVAEQQRMARRTFLDVKPTVPGMDVTTLRAHCLVCHRNKVATFDTHSPRPVEFSPPLKRPARETLTLFYKRIEIRFRKWKSAYLQAPSR